MDLKHEHIIYGGTAASVIREDVMLVKTEPRVQSPSNSSNGLNNNLLGSSGSNLQNTSNGLLVANTVLINGVSVPLAALHQHNLVNNGGSSSSNGMNSNGSVSFSAGLLQQSVNSGNGPSVVITSAGKRPRTEDWSTQSPGNGQGSIGPPLTPSPGPPGHNYAAISSNGYSSPMSSGSYDPYSPTGKIGMSIFIFENLYIKEAILSFLTAV